MLWKQARQQILNARQLLLLCHDFADRDAFGSVTAFGLWLQDKGVKFTFAYFGDPPPYSLILDTSFDIGTWMQQTIDPANFDLLVVLDTGATHLLGQAEQFVLSAQIPIINIDHHKSNDQYGAINIVDPSTAACAELLFNLFNQTGDTITPDIAQALMVGLMGDTHGLHTSHVSPQTLRAAASLMELGADRVRVLEEMPPVKSVVAARMWGELLQNIQVVDDIIAYTVAPREMVAFADQRELVGISSFIRDMGGIEISVLFLQEEIDNIRVEFRAKWLHDVGKIAESLGGGGHRGASGCRFKDTPLEDAIAQTIAAIQKGIINPS